MCYFWQAGAETICFITVFEQFHAPEKLQQQKPRFGGSSFFSSGSKKNERIVPGREPQQGW